MKKLEFSDFLKKKLPPFIVVILIISVIIFMITYYGIMTSADMFNMVTESEARGKIDDEEMSNINRKWVLALYYDATMNKDMRLDSAAVLVDDETKEIVVDSSLNGFAIISKSKSETGKPVYLLNKSEEYRKTLESYAKEGIQTNIDIEEIYVDGEYFYPGRVTISEVDNTVEDMIVGEPVEYDFTPDNASDYKKVDYHSLEIAMGSLSEGKAMRALLADPENPDASGDFEYYSKNYVSIDGKNYCLATLSYLDFWGAYGTSALIIIGIMAVLVIIAKISRIRYDYKKYCAQYEVDEYRRNMTNALAHDLKTPLTAIYGYAENLKNNVHSEKKDYYAEAVLENVNYMNSIIENTLELAKLENGSADSKPESINLAAMSAELFEKYRPVAEEKGIKLSIKGKTTVTADKETVSRAIENLISNAVRYTVENGTIEINADEKIFVMINTCDKSLKGDTEIFCKPFTKADKSRNDRRGSGIGLSLVKNITALNKLGFEVKAENGKFTAAITLKKK